MKKDFSIKETAEKLSRHSCDRPRVVSLVLGVEGDEYIGKNQLRMDVSNTVRQAQAHVEDIIGLETADKRAVVSDLNLITKWMDTQYIRGKEKSLLFFVCSEIGLFEVLPVNESVSHTFEVSRSPNLVALEALAIKAHGTGVILVNKEIARIYTFRFNELRLDRVIEDEVPNKHHKGGWSQMRYQRHVEDHVYRHLSRASNVTSHVLDVRKWDSVLIAGPEEVRTMFTGLLHPYVTQRIVGDLSLSVDISESELERIVSKSVERLNRESDQKLLWDLERAIDQSDSGVQGIENATREMSDSRLEVLFVRDHTLRDMDVQGYRCQECGYLTTSGQRCKRCGADLEEHIELVDALMQEAFKRGCKVRVVADDIPSWALKDVAAIRRY